MCVDYRGEEMLNSTHWTARKDANSGKPAKCDPDSTKAEAKFIAKIEVPLA
jgi:hypothetical protein